MGAVVSDRSRETLLVMEKMEYGSLRTVLHDEALEIDVTLRLSWLRDVASGLSFLHSQRPTKLLHCDLTSESILINSVPMAKLSCVGFSQKKLFSKQGTLFGTKTHMAPELLSGHSRHTTMSDVYSFGCVACEVFTRSDLYVSDERNDLDCILREVADPNKQRRPPRPTNCPAFISELIRDCLQHNAADRPKSNSLEEQLQSATENSTRDDSSSPWFGPHEGRIKSFKQFFRRRMPESSLQDATEERTPDSNPKLHNMVSVLIADVTPCSTSVTNSLQTLKGELHHLCSKYNILRVETIGDAIMAGKSWTISHLSLLMSTFSLLDPVTNLHEEQPDHAGILVRFALDALKAAEAVTRSDEEAPHPDPMFKLQVALHSGPCLTRVVGNAESSRYAVTGETVRVACNLQRQCLPGRIHCSSITRSLILNGAKENDLRFEPRGSHQLKDGKVC